MDTPRQILRWSIPGWLFVFLLFFYIGVVAYFNGELDLSSERIQQYIEQIGAESAAVFIAAGIPLGFVIYQFYYVWVGNVFFLYLVGVDRGYLILSKLPKKALKKIGEEIHEEIHKEIKTTKEMVVEKEILRIIRWRLLKSDFRNLEGINQYRKYFRKNWEINRYLLNRITLHTGSTTVHKEFINLSDIYHSLGASRVALIFALIGCLFYVIFYYFLHSAITYCQTEDPGFLSLLYKLILVLRQNICERNETGQNYWGTFIGFFVVTVVFAIIFSVLSLCRHNARVSMESFLIYSFRAYFRNRLPGDKTKP